MKLCPDCGVVKPLDDFYGKGQKGTYCKPCAVKRSVAWWRANRERVNANRRRWKEKNPESIRATNLKIRYNLTPEQYEAMLVAQGWVCAICHQRETTTRNGKVKRLHVDHDHSCCPGIKSCGKCIRGLLCTTCNVRVGMLEDQTLREKGLAYLEEYQVTSLKELL